MGKLTGIRAASLKAFRRRPCGALPVVHGGCIALLPDPESRWRVARGRKGRFGTGPPPPQTWGHQITVMWNRVWRVRCRMRLRCFALDWTAPRLRYRIREEVRMEIKSIEVALPRSTPRWTAVVFRRRAPRYESTWRPCGTLCGAPATATYEVASRAGELARSIRRVLVLPAPGIRLGNLTLWLVVALAAGISRGWVASTAGAGKAGAGVRLEDTRGNICRSSSVLFMSAGDSRGRAPVTTLRRHRACRGSRRAFSRAARSAGPARKRHA